jgi:integrase
MFSYALQRGMIKTNPIKLTASPRIVNNTPGILSVGDLTTLLNTASTVAPDMIPAIAIGFFAGVREAEIRRMDWKEINLQHGEIEIPASKAKGAARRIITMQPNLADWLRPYSGKTGPVLPANARKKIDAVKETAEVTVPRNAARHSFASYRFAATSNAPLVISELGHMGNPVVFERHYRAVVRKPEAERYFDIKPEAEAGNVVSFAGQA